MNKPTKKLVGNTRIKLVSNLHTLRRKFIAQLHTFRLQGVNFGGNNSDGW